MDTPYRQASAIAVRRRQPDLARASWTRRLRWAWERYAMNAQISYRIDGHDTCIRIKYRTHDAWPNFDEAFSVPCDLVGALADWLDTHIAEVPVEMKNIHGQCFTLKKCLLPAMRVVVREAAEIVRLRSMQPQFEASR